MAGEREHLRSDLYRFVRGDVCGGQDHFSGIAPKFATAPIKRETGNRGFVSDHIFHSTELLWQKRTVFSENITNALPRIPSRLL